MQVTFTIQLNAEEDVNNNKDDESLTSMMKNKNLLGIVDQAGPSQGETCDWFLNHNIGSELFQGVSLFIHCCDNNRLGTSPWECVHPSESTEKNISNTLLSSMF